MGKAGFCHWRSSTDRRWPCDLVVVSGTSHDGAGIGDYLGILYATKLLPDCEGISHNLHCQHNSQITSECLQLMNAVHMLLAMVRHKQLGHSRGPRCVICSRQGIHNAAHALARYAHLIVHHQGIYNLANSWRYMLPSGSAEGCKDDGFHCHGPPGL